MTIIRTQGTDGEINVGVSRAAEKATPGLAERVHDAMLEVFPKASIRTVVGMRAVGTVKGYERDDIEAILSLFEPAPATVEPQTISYDEQGTPTDITPGPTPEAAPLASGYTEALTEAYSAAQWAGEWHSGNFAQAAIGAFGCEPEAVAAIAEDVGAIERDDLLAILADGPLWVLQYAVMVAYRRANQ